ncbi:methyltransferase domain-containing protein [Pseudenhygromyxa sp. WMMC2535]|uniref:class I SAM-dependent methyltransferase n=1 Tax=Pseudenhygromyxa sp. WMMC2535 TaxID=2712867 RepID=UPI001557397B|nr:methyltransferase domain-containing protein [Pseudenhygromyxa sp. WMMC2535]NVB39550.1 methyltransferase domain-containing protein [Pseudenhygromyxa sp. WMMC2535]
MRALSPLLCCCCCALSLACAHQASDPDATKGPGTTADAAPDTAGSSASATPGINDRYLDDDAVDKWTKVFEQERRDVISHRDEIVAALELEPGMAVADIGAGTGAFVEPIARGVGPEGKVYAVDIIPDFLARLRGRAAEAQLDWVEVVEATPQSPALAPASVDLLFLCDVYHHLEYPSVYLRGLREALRPGGRMIIIDFDKIPGKTSAGMMKHVRQDQATLLAEVRAEGFELAREIDSVPLKENYMLEFVVAPSS